MLTVFLLKIFSEAEVTMDHYFLNIMSIALCTAGYVISTYLTTKLPRKVHYIVAAIFLAFNLITSGIILKLKETSNDDTSAFLANNILPVCVVLCGLFYGLGVGPVPFALLGEVLPQRIKAVASSLILTARESSIFTNLKFFPAFTNAFGTYAAFWLYSGVLILGILIAFFFVPETRGKTLTELSELFEKKRTAAHTQTALQFSLSTQMTKEQEANQSKPC